MEIKLYKIFLGHFLTQNKQKIIYPKVASRSNPQLVTHPRVFRLFLKGKSGAYTFGQKGLKLNSSPFYCLRLYVLKLELTAMPDRQCKRQFVDFLFEQNLCTICYHFFPTNCAQFLCRLKVKKAYLTQPI